MKNENCDINQLIANIDSLCSEYDYGGTKESIGIQSNRIAISALKALCECFNK